MDFGEMIRMLVNIRLKLPYPLLAAMNGLMWRLHATFIIEFPSPALNMTVLVVGEGFSLKAAGGNVATGCNGVGPGVAIPKKNGHYDYEGLNQCAAKLKASSPDFADEETVSITANPGVEYQIIIGVMDALRRDFRRPSEILFDKVNFKVSK